MGFEPTEHFCSTVFKTVALIQALPTLHVWWRILELNQCNIGLQPIALPTELILHVTAQLRAVHCKP